MTTDETGKKMHFSLDLRVLVVALLVVIVVMLLIWKPWSETSDATGRSIKVTGEATVSAEPDEFLFYPSYEFHSSDKSAALSDMTKKSDELIGQLKKLGVADQDIKSNADGSDGRVYFAPQADDANTYSLQLTITAHNRTTAQKIQDYLLTTSPTGQITPYPTFSDAKRKSLESDARNKATQDARAKADQSARNLEAKLGKVKSVADGAGFGNVTPLEKGVATDAVAPSLSVQPGQNDINYTVTVEFYLK